MDERKPSIMVVEDDTVMARLNSRLLKRQGYDVYVACTAVEARALIHSVKADLFVLDVGLPDGSGLELCKEFREESDAPVLFLTGRTGAVDKIAGLDSGGDYYLTKPYDKDEFIAVVRSLLRRAKQTEARIAEATIIDKGSLVLKLDERRVYVEGMDAGLSVKEFAVLLSLVQNENKEVPYDRLYESAWGSAMNNDSTSLRQLISRMKKKLDELNAPDYSIVNEHGVGYTFFTF